MSWRAHAKLTLSLHISGVRVDGYHLIDAEMVSLELHDLLTFDDRPTTSIDATGPFAVGVPLDGTNLVARALVAAGRTAHVSIDKRIPHGGGLGGGSTDAASALRWGGFDTSRNGLARAAQLGADIPFCLLGGRARVTGIGEIVDPLPHVSRSITLIIPPLQVSTPAVYRAWDELDPASRSGARNDLEQAALVVAPELARWRDSIAEHFGVAPTLAGSGATYFVEGEFSDDAAPLEALGATVVRTYTVDAERATGPGV